LSFYTFYTLLFTWFLFSSFLSKFLIGSRDGLLSMLVFRLSTAASCTHLLAFLMGIVFMPVFSSFNPSLDGLGSSFFS
jgi:hypothetical protein